MNYIRPKRKKIDKKTREDVYSKYGGHCAYCGEHLEYKDMQVDHLIPLMGWSVQGEDTIENMMPSCRQCNLYKRANSLEGWRNMLESMTSVLYRDNATYRNAVRFRQVIENKHPVEFYFEKINKMREIVQGEK